MFFPKISLGCLRPFCFRVFYTDDFELCCTGTPGIVLSPNMSNMYSHLICIVILKTKNKLLEWIQSSEFVGF